MNHIARFFVVSTLLFMGVFSVFAFAHADEEVIEEETVITDATVVVTSIVCDNEANLPNLGFGGPDISGVTAEEFLTLHTNCQRASGWQFQYDTTLAVNPGDNLMSEASSPWQSTSLTDGNGTATFIVPTQGVSQIRVREVLKDGYIGFTHGDATDNSIGYTAELYCDTDVINYDNFDYVNAPMAGNTYHCVAWNAPKRVYAPFCGDNVVNQSWEVCDGGVNCTEQCQTPAEQCTENVFARVVVENTENIGAGDVSDMMYVGGVAQPDWAWFPVKVGGTTVVDADIATFQSVPGVAIERSLAGIRVRLFGSHDDESREHSQGYVEFSSGTTLSSLTGETGVNAVENGSDSIMEKTPGQDELWTVGNTGHYWFTVSGQNDGFVATYTGAMCQSEVTDMCSNLEGVQASVPEGMTATEGICTATEGGDGNGGNTGGGNGGSGGGGSPAPACADGSDNDNDGKADYPADLGCSSSLDGDESGDGSTPASASAPGSGLGTTTGEVLGATTGEPALPPSCSAYIGDYMRFGKKNDIEEVKKLQEFLNESMGTNIPVTGYFGALTRDLVKKFQKKYHTEILKPWIDAGWKGKDLENGTGYVYKTTKRWINLMKCQSLDIPLPDLKAS